MQVYNPTQSELHMGLSSSHAYIQGSLRRIAAPSASSCPARETQNLASRETPTEGHAEDQYRARQARSHTHGSNSSRERTLSAVNVTRLEMANAGILISCDQLIWWDPHGFGMALPWSIRFPHTLVTHSWFSRSPLLIRSPALYTPLPTPAASALRRYRRSSTSYKSMSLIGERTRSPSRLHGSCEHYCNLSSAYD